MKIIAGLLLLGSLTACGGGTSDVQAAGGDGCDEGAGFSRNMDSSGGGEATPEAALDAAAAEDLSNYPFKVPTDGWVTTGDSSRQQTSRAGDVELTLLRLEDGTWAVESGRCISG